MSTRTRVLGFSCALLVFAACTTEILQAPEGLAVESAVVAPTGPVKDSVVFTLTTINISGRAVAFHYDPQWSFDLFAWDSGAHVVWRLHPYPVVGIPPLEPPLSIGPGQRYQWTAVWHLRGNYENLPVGPGTYWLVGYLSGAAGLIRSDSVRVDVVD